MRVINVGIPENYNDGARLQEINDVKEIIANTHRLIEQNTLLNDVINKRVSLGLGLKQHVILSKNTVEHISLKDPEPAFPSKWSQIRLVAIFIDRNELLEFSINCQLENASDSVTYITIRPNGDGGTYVNLLGYDLYFKSNSIITVQPRVKNLFENINLMFTNAVVAAQPFVLHSNQHARNLNRVLENIRKPSIPSSIKEKIRALNFDEPYTIPQDLQNYFIRGLFNYSVAKSILVNIGFDSLEENNDNIVIFTNTKLAAFYLLKADS